MVDVAEQVDAVRRTVGREGADGGAVHALTLAIEVAVEAGELWSALTRPRRLSRWFLPVNGDLRVGGRYALEGNASGTVEACDAPRSFAVTWEFAGDTSHVRVHVEPAGHDRARLTLEHRTRADDASWAEHGPGATGIGWDLSLLGLVLYLAAGGEADPAESAWAGEDDGLRFLHLSGEAWHDADVAAGTDPAEARLRADRTIGAYTAPQDDDG